MSAAGNGRGPAHDLSDYRKPEGKSFKPPAEGVPFVPFKKFWAVRIPYGLLEYPGISFGAKCTWGVLESHAGENGRCYPGAPRVARWMGISVTQARAYLKELEKEHFLNINLRPGDTSTYDLLWHKCFDGLAGGSARKVPRCGKKKGQPYRKTDTPPIGKPIGQTLSENRYTPYRKTDTESVQGIRSGSKSVKGIPPSSSSPPAKPDRKPPQREEEEDAIVEIAILLAVNTYVTAGPAFARRLCCKIREKNPDLSPSQMVDVIHESVPPGLRVTSPGFFMSTAPDTALAPRFTAQGRQSHDKVWSDYPVYEAPWKAKPKTDAPFSAEELRENLTARAGVVSAAGFRNEAEVLYKLAADADQYPSNLEELELILTELEKQIMTDLWSNQSEEQRLAARKPLDEHLRPYRGKMSKEQRGMLERQYIERHLLEQSGLPRLSLFYWPESGAKTSKAAS